MKTDVVIYARLSQEDLAEGQTGTERQIADCREKADEEGWNVLGTYEDPDISASDLRRKRPDFERMMADLGDGVHVDVILCWKLDRLLRHPKEAERIIDLAIERGIGIVSLNDPGTDLTTPTGRFMFRTFINMAKAETETMSLRIQRKARAVAETGEPNGGGIRPFGLRGIPAVRDARGKAVEPYHYEVVEDERALIREAADRLVSGESVHSVVSDWNARGIRTPGRAVAPEGRRWEVSSLKRMLTAPRIVGDREHHGAVPEGAVGKGKIPPMLDRATWDRLTAVLRAPRGTGGGGTVRRHFLTGIVVCGRCGARMVCRPSADGTQRYVCAPPRGCGGIVVAAGNLEPLITEAIAHRLDSPGFRAAVDAKANRTDLSTELDAIAADRAALAELAGMYLVERTIDKASYTSTKATLDRRIEDGERKVRSRTSSATLGRIAGLDLRAEWTRQAAPWKHEVAAALIERITVNPAPRRGTRFDPDRISVEWRA